jgi:hypothetical protein
MDTQPRLLGVKILSAAMRVQVQSRCFGTAWGTQAIKIGSLYHIEKQKTAVWLTRVLLLL